MLFRDLAIGDKFVLDDGRVFVKTAQGDGTTVDSTGVTGADGRSTGQPRQ